MPRAFGTSCGLQMKIVILVTSEILAPPAASALVRFAHHHLGLGVEIFGRQHLAVHVRSDLAGAEYELLRALGRHHVGVI